MSTSIAPRFICATFIEKDIGTSEYSTRSEHYDSILNIAVRFFRVSEVDWSAVLSDASIGMRTHGEAERLRLCAALPRVENLGTHWRSGHTGLILIYLAARVACACDRTRKEILMQYQVFILSKDGKPVNYPS